MIKYHERDYGSVVANKFRDYLWGDKQVAESTVDAYCISVRAFCDFTGIFDEDAIKTIDGKAIRNFVEHLRHDEYEEGKKYLVSSINIKIVGMNQFLEFHKLANLKASQLDKQRKLFINDAEKLEDLELSKLLNEAKNEDEELHCVLRSLVQTGMRASETKSITYESLQNGYIDVDNKGTYRQVPLPKDLKLELSDYCERNGIIKGSIFTLDRIAIGRKMKRLGLRLGIGIKKLHPHNLRHYFALKFINIYGEDALSVLADILGHKSIETTRIYLTKTLSELSDKVTADSLKIKIAS